MKSIISIRLKIQFLRLNNIILISNSNVHLRLTSKSKKKPTNIPKEKEKSVLTHNPLSISIGVTIVFFGLSLIGILRHEMWRDEYQAWMVASDADSMAGLFRNLKYEGHPSLWYILLYIISSVADHPFGMQLLHILLSAGAVFLINRHAPFPLWQRILLTFGYFVFYE